MIVQIECVHSNLLCSVSTLQPLKTTRTIRGLGPGTLRLLPSRSLEHENPSALYGSLPSNDYSRPF